MKIIYTGNFRFPTYDAAAARVLNNAKAFRALGHEVIFLSWGGRYREEDHLNGQYFYQGFEYTVTDELKDSHRSLFNKISGVVNKGNRTLQLLKQKGQVDLVIVYNPPLGFTKVCINYCKKHNIYFAADLTEWYAANEFPGGKWSPLYWMSEWNMKHTLERVKNKIVISSFLNAHYHYSNNLLVPPLTDVKEPKWGKRLHQVPEVIAHHHGTKLLFAGNPAQKDLLANILQAVLLFEGKIQMIVVGINEKQGECFVDIEKWKQYPESIVFVGRIPQEDVPAYYYLADFSVIARKPDRKNMAGFPTKMAESYTAGCPVMLNETSDLIEYAKDGVNAIVLKDFTVNSITTGIRRLLHLTSEELQQMKSMAKTTGRDFFDYRPRVAPFHYFIENLKN